MTDDTKALCGLCGEPMPEGEAMFKFHGYSGPCPKPPLPHVAPVEPPYNTKALVELLAATIERLERELAAMTADRDSWEQQASDRVDDVLAMAARADKDECDLIEFGALLLDGDEWKNLRRPNVADDHQFVMVSTVKRLLAERDALKMSLREAQIDVGSEKTKIFCKSHCAQCNSNWMAGQPECHKPECLAKL